MPDVRVFKDGLWFEWDADKAARNLAKHNVPFEDAITVFFDRYARTDPDPEHSLEEDRERTIGQTWRRQLIVVIHTTRDNRFRIVSARRATGPLRRAYEG